MKNTSFVETYHYKNKSCDNADKVLPANEKQNKVQ